MKHDSGKHRSSRRSLSGWRLFVSALGLAVLIVVLVVLGTKFLAGPGADRTAADKTIASSSVTELMPTSAESLANFQLFMSRCKQAPDCPYYALNVKGNTLEYVGVRNVAKRGEKRQALSSDRKRKLLKLVKKSGFFALADHYDLSSPGCKAARMDAPTLTIGVTLNGETKVVKVNQACANVPKQLTDLAHGIDRISRSGRWTGAGTSATTGS